MLSLVRDNDTKLSRKGFDTKSGAQVLSTVRNDDDQKSLSMQAYTMALRSLTLIEEHTKSCDQRYGVVVKLLGWGGGVIFMVLVGIAAYMLKRFGLPAP